MTHTTKEKKYSISTIRGYANLLFNKGALQVPLITQIEAFLDDFERWASLVDGLNDKTCSKK